MPQQVQHTCAVVRGGGAAPAGDVTIAVHEGFPALTETRLLGAGVGARHWEVDTTWWRGATDISHALMCSFIFIKASRVLQGFPSSLRFVPPAADRGGNRRTSCCVTTLSVVADNAPDVVHRPQDLLQNPVMKPSLHLPHPSCWAHVCCEDGATSVQPARTLCAG